MYYVFVFLLFVSNILCTGHVGVYCACEELERELEYIDDLFHVT